VVQPASPRLDASQGGLVEPETSPAWDPSKRTSHGSLVVCLRHGLVKTKYVVQSRRSDR